MSPAEAILTRRVAALVLRRAKDLAVVVAGPGVFLVEGGQEPHWVGFTPYPSCDCGHFLVTDTTCKHIVAVLRVLDDAGITTQTLNATGAPVAVLEPA